MRNIFLILLLCFTLIEYAIASDKTSCPNLSNDILKKQNAGTYFKPSGDKTSLKKDSRKYTEALRKLYEEQRAAADIFIKEFMNPTKKTKHIERSNLRELEDTFRKDEYVIQIISKIDSLDQKDPDHMLSLAKLYYALEERRRFIYGEVAEYQQREKNRSHHLDPKQARYEFYKSNKGIEFRKKIKTLKNNFNATPGMQHLIDKNIDFTEVIRFKNKGKEIDFIYDGKTLVAISSRGKTTKEESYYHQYKQTEEDLLILNNCKISTITHINEKKYHDNMGSFIFKYLSAPLCRDLHQIKKLALTIDNNVDDFAYNCRAQKGTILKGERGCKCLETGNYFNPRTTSCSKDYKKRKIKTPPWIKFKDFVSSYGQSWTTSEYTNKTYQEIEEKCLEYRKHLDLEQGIKGTKKNHGSRVLSL